MRRLDWRRGPESAVCRRVAGTSKRDFQGHPSTIGHHSPTAQLCSVGVRFGVPSESAHVNFFPTERQMPLQGHRLYLESAAPDSLL